MGRTVASQLIDELEKAGIKHFYAIAGDSLNAINSEMRKSRIIKWVHMRHEESGAFAAAAESFLTGLACCGGSSGPGHVHLVNGLYDANRGNLPVIAIASTCSSEEFGTDYFQETNVYKLFDDCSCYTQVASTPGQFARMLPSVIRNAVCCKGVAVLGLPGNIEPKEAEELVSSIPQSEESVIMPPSDAVNALANAINESKRIAVFCGIGASGAQLEIIELAQKIKAPIASTFRGKMYIERENPYYVGLTGLLGTPAAYKAMNDCDLLLMLGTDFPYTGFIPTGKLIAQVDIRGQVIGRRTKVDLSIVGDVKCTLLELIPLLKIKDESVFLEKSLKLYENVKSDLADIVSDKGTFQNIAPEYLASMINSVAGNNAIFTVDTGMCCSWAARYIEAGEGRQMLASYNHGSMCNALPMAIGSAFACPNTEIVAICGDGGISMMLGELATVVQYDLPIKIIVFNNRALGMVKLEMEIDGYIDSETDMLNPDFSKIAEAMGIKSYKVEEASLLEDTLKDAFAYSGAVLVDVYTNPNAITMPPKISTSQIKGFSMALTRMLAGGDVNEILNIVKSSINRL